MAVEEGLFEVACNLVLETFGLESLKDLQRKALLGLINGKDVVVIQPTGSGKSLIFQSAPIIFDAMNETSGTNSSTCICIVISPLVSLMQDQVSFLKSKGITAAFIGDEQKDEGVKMAVERGEYQLVYGSPESFLSSKRWRKMLTSAVYQKSLCLIAVDEAHCISHWGYSAKKGELAFRKWFGRINEIRSLVGKVPLIALTATATTKTRTQIIRALEMKNPELIVESPNKQNITYGVKVINPTPKKTFQTMVNNLKEQKGSYERTIIYCPTIKLTTHLYGFFQAELGKFGFVDETCDPRKRLVEMFHSRIDELNRDEILKSMAAEEGSIRVLIATIAYGMGIDCKGVKTVIHYGPSHNIETYMQESGRAGRSNSDICKSVILYSNIVLKHFHESMIQYVRETDRCRRKMLLEKFDVDLSIIPVPAHPHLCCDVCQRHCTCNGNSCNFVFLDFGSACIEVDERQQKRTVSEQQVEVIGQKLDYLKKALNQQVMKTYKKVPMFTPVNLLCGFGDNQIVQIIEHCKSIFSLSDVYKFVDVWHNRVAVEVLHTINVVFGDIPVDMLLEEESEQENDQDNLDLELFNFEVEDSVLADIPMNLFSITEDTFNDGIDDDSDLHCD